MAKYDITYSCGHSGRVELFGKQTERNSKIRWYETNADCPDCYAAKQTADNDIIEMHYSEYKNNYEDYKTVAGSYNPKTKTIKVYVPKTGEESVAEIAKSKKAKDDHDLMYKKDITTMSKSEIFRVAHIMTKKYKAKTPSIDYKAQFGAILKYMYAEIKRINAAKIVA